MQKALIALALVSQPPLAVEDPLYTKLSGDMVITGEDPSDPPPPDKYDRVGIFLEGKAAERLYRAMPQKPKNYCDVSLMKDSGTLACYKDQDGSYSCSVALLLKTGKSAHIGSC